MSSDSGPGPEVPPTKVLFDLGGVLVDISNTNPIHWDRMIETLDLQPALADVFLRGPLEARDALRSHGIQVTAR